MKKWLLTTALAIIDIALLVLIVVSAKSTGNGSMEMPATTAEASIAEVTSPTDTKTVTSPAETTVTQTQDENTESIPEVTTFPGTSVPETSSTVPWWAVVPETSPAATEESETFRDISAYNTKELPHINDFKWVTPEILNGVCPDEAEILYFEETLGGWKCYIIENETEVERLANMELTGGTMEEMQLRFDWYYTRSGGKDGEVYEDNSPDSVFEGYVNDDGEIEAEGPGRIRVTDIYVIGDHMYAFGTISWPDGISGSLLLVRP